MLANIHEVIENQSKEIQVLKSELHLYQQRCEQYSQAYDSLQRQISELLRNRFGKKSERYIDPESPQMSFFNEGLPTFAEANAAGAVEDEPVVTVPAYNRSKKKKSKELPRRIEIISVSEQDRQCGCCGKIKDFIRYETKDILHYQPPVFEIIEQRREILSCPTHCEASLVIAPAPLQVLPKIKATEHFLAFLIVSKLDDRQPLYHLEKQLFTRYGVDCSRQTMARWLIDLVTPLQPLYNLLKDTVIDYDVASCDATTLQVLKEKERPAETKSYVYCMRGGPPENEVVLYDYNDRLHKDFVKNWFEGFEGYLHVDGDNFFELIGQTAKLVNCNAHARRKFEPITKQAKGQGLAKEALRFFKALYKIERQAKDEKMIPEQRYELRQKESKPLMLKFKKWLDELYPTVLPQSSLGLAMNYCIKLWQGLTRCLEDGRLEVDNNLTEQEIKPFVIARKNFLFSDSVDGAHALCMHFSLIRTAKAHGLDPYHYYVDILKNIPLCASVEDYEKLLPWNIGKNTPVSSHINPTQ